MTNLVHPGFDPGDPDTFYAPDYLGKAKARELGVTVDKLLSPRYAKTVHAVIGMAQARDLAYRLGGRAKKPPRELVLVGPDGKTPIIIPALGCCEAAELEDIAIAACEKQQAKLDKGQEAVDFDELRRREGRPIRTEFDPMFRQALRDRIAKHNINPVSDPSRQPIPTRGLIPVAKPREEPEVA